MLDAVIGIVNMYIYILYKAFRVSQSNMGSLPRLLGPCLSTKEIGVLPNFQQPNEISYIYALDDFTRRSLRLTFIYCYCNLAKAYICHFSYFLFSTHLAPQNLLLVPDIAMRHSIARDGRT